MCVSLGERFRDHFCYQMQGEFFDGACLLCSEATPEHCHRRLPAEYLRERWGAGIRLISRRLGGRESGWLPCADPAG